MINDFQDLLVWKKSHALVLEIYSMTKLFPREERFGLTQQMRRAAISVPANIAEGFKRRGHRDKVHFYNISQSSLQEVRYYLFLARDLKYVTSADSYFDSTDEIGKCSMD
ncbi:four helix bundle protein [Candidatus Omnitrophota bacterium]